MKRQLIVDANNLLYRSYWVGSKSNIPGQEIYIFLRALKSYVDKYKPDITWCAWDKKVGNTSAPNFRQIAHPDYKAGRDSDKFKDVYENWDDLTEAIKSIGCHNIFPYQLEADDFMAWLACETGPTGPLKDKSFDESVIVTADKDLLQLVNPCVTVYNPLSKIEFNALNFEEITGFKDGLEYLWFRVFTGDKSDNIPGIGRVGKKKFKKLTEGIEFERDPKLLKSIPLTPEQIKIAVRNYVIMDLQFGYNRPSTTNFDEVSYIEREHYEDTYVDSMLTQAILDEGREFNWRKFNSICESYNFPSIIHNMNAWRETFSGESTLVNCVNNLKDKFKGKE